MNANTLLNSLNELKKKCQMRGYAERSIAVLQQV